MLFRNIEDFDDDLIGKNNKNNKNNLKGLDPNTINIFIDQTNKSGIITEIDSDGNFIFPTCGTLHLDNGATANIQNRSGVEISCAPVPGKKYYKILCKDGIYSTNCCGDKVCSEDGGCYQIKYDDSTKEFTCEDEKPSGYNLFSCDFKEGCIITSDMENAMTQKECIKSCKKYKKCQFGKLVDTHSTVKKNIYYDYDDDTLFPNNPCDLKDQTVVIKSKNHCNVSAPGCAEHINVIKPKVCDLIKNNVNGCNDVNRGLNTTGRYPMKGGTGGSECMLGEIDSIPFGVKGTAYGAPRINFNPFGDWCAGVFAEHEKDMCPMKGNCGSQGQPQDFDYYNKGKLKGTFCSLGFKLGPQNQDACK